MTIYETRTALPPFEVVERARTFFMLTRATPSPWPEQAGEGHLRLGMEVGEIVIGAHADGGSTRVRGSASRGAHLLARFLIDLAPPERTDRATHRHGGGR